jgi:cytochrome c oxidase subunit IV
MSLTHSHDVPAPVADDVGPEAPHGVHAVPRRVLLGVYGALLVFTAITVTVSFVDLGNANIWVALLIALIKGSLVCLYFMHLRWDSPFNALALIAALFFVALFIGLALLDSNSYQPQLKPTPMAVKGP